MLTPEALDLVVELEREFGGRRKELLGARAERQERISGGDLPDFLESTRAVREGDWRVAGETGYVLVVTGAGTTVEEARKQAYGRVDNIMLQNMFYRTDVGGSWAEDSDRLQTWGYLY